MWGVEEASINIMRRGDNSLSPGVPSWPQPNVWPPSLSTNLRSHSSLQHSAVLHCSVVYSLQMLLPHSNYLNLHYASVYQNYSFSELEVFFYVDIWEEDLVKPKPYSISDRCQGSGCGKGRLSWTEEGFPGDFPVSSALPRMIPSPPETTFKLQINFVLVSCFMI